VLAGSSPCTGKDEGRISEKLLGVDWVSLAGELEDPDGKLQMDNKVASIEFDCKSSSTDIAKCCRRKLVKAYCDSTGWDVEEIVEHIASALERIGNKKQGDAIKALYPASKNTESPPKPPPDQPRPPTTSRQGGTPGPTSSSSDSETATGSGSTTPLGAIHNIPLEVAGAIAVLTAVGLLCFCLFKIRGSKQPNSSSRDPDNESEPPKHEPKSSSRPPKPLEPVDAMTRETLRHRQKPNNPVPTSPVFGEQADIPSLLLIQYYDRYGELKQLRVRDEITPKWKELGLSLGLGSAKVDNIEGSKKEESAFNMLSEWVRQEGATWGKLVGKLREVRLGNLAAKLEHALQNRDKSE
jgi:hypothetical protein